MRIVLCLVLCSLLIAATFAEEAQHEEKKDEHHEEEPHHDEHHDDEHHEEGHDDEHHDKRVHDGLSEQEHEVGDDHHHNPEYDHEAFLGKGEAHEYDKLAPEESKQKLGELFPQVDDMVASDGFVTAEELAKWIDMKQASFVRSDSDTLLEHNDVDKDGTVTWDEYVKVTYTDDKESQDSEETKAEHKARDEPRFKAADKNADGKLDKDEFHAFLHPEFHDYMKPQVVKETLQEVDKDKDGFISADEYMSDLYPESKRKANETEPEWVLTARKQFVDKLDKSKDGKLDAGEVKDWVLPDTNEHVQLEANHLLTEADTDKDGKISKEEMLEHWEVFVGSQQQNSFSDIFQSEQNHEEL